MASKLAPFDFIKRKKYCSKENGFLSTPFDIESIKLLNKIKLKCFKIPSEKLQIYLISEK